MLLSSHLTYGERFAKIVTEYLPWSSHCHVLRIGFKVRLHVCVCFESKVAAVYAGSGTAVRRCACRWNSRVLASSSRVHVKLAQESLEMTWTDNVITFMLSSSQRALQYPC